MISFNFDYYKPSSIVEAVRLFDELDKQNKKPLYYAGGTEIITFARKDDLFTRAVIDIKGIPQCMVIEDKESQIIIGAGITLTGIAEARFFPLLTKTSSFAADHTARNKITIGGNICGKIMFKEAVLTPLVTDSMVVIAGIRGVRTVPINEVFNQRLMLNKGEFIVQIIIDGSYIDLPYYARKRTKISKVDYPLLSTAAIKKSGKIRIALSGVTNFPFRSVEVEEIINETSLTPKERAKEAIKHLPSPILDNLQAGREYREFLLEKTLVDIISSLEGRCYDNL